MRLLAAIALDDKDNLFIYDAIDQRITVLRAPDYEAITHQFQIPSPLSSFIALPTGAVVTFFPAGDHVFTKYDAAGRKAASADLRLDKKLRVFHGRIQTGSVITSGTRDLFGVHPASFSIVRMSPGLRILEFFKGKRGDKWAPRPDRFPADLNPYGFKRGHELWWNGFTHIGRLYSLTGNHLLLSMFKSMGLNQEQSFVNVYDVNGRVLARGLAVPHSALVVGAGDSRVFLARNVRLNADESVDPLHFYSYRLTYRDVTQ
ncbi:MAG: hypothetical protein ACT443_08290 [Gemmatimonadota bacterium]